MFAPHPLAVTKTVDRDVASGGDRLLYTVQVGASGGSFGATKVVDTLPAGVAYAPGTARVDNVPVEPLARRAHAHLDASRISAGSTRSRTRAS